MVLNFNDYRTITSNKHVDYLGEMTDIYDNEDFHAVEFLAVTNDEVRIGNDLYEE